MKLHVILIAITLLAFPVVSSRAHTISWGGVTEGELFTSYGTTLDDSFVFELGTFGSFVPTMFNRTDWASNWKTFDRAVAGDGWDSTNQYFSSEATLDEFGHSDSPYSGSNLFNPGERAYIWVYNSQQFHQGSEWALISGLGTGGSSSTTWLMPAAGDQSALPYDWRVNTAAEDETVIGGLNGDRGPGDYTAEPPSYDIQTAAVPEPTAVLMLGCALAMRSLRRRRRTGR
ncbi:MAG: PEP-CTERM sorting domain-containing protein [Verrucomicrobiaceae bacterium]|nr:PEP-CTERM sorting domain-containing protein [Verrucomicrobiaceae bacterium]